MSACVVCYEEVSSSDYSLFTCNQCQQPISNECFIEWTKTQLSQQAQTEHLSWKCPTTDCGATLELPQLVCSLRTYKQNPCSSKMVDVEAQKNYKISKKKAIAIINESGLKHYQRTCLDIKFCPKEGCPYTGYISRQELL